MIRKLTTSWRRGAAACFLVWIAGGASAEVNSESLAKSVTVYRDAWGVPHIDGPTDVSVSFAFAYTQAQDYFWQVEDNFILGMGRYSEFHGAIGLNSDMLNRAYEVVRKSQEDYPKLEPRIRELFDASVAGFNFYLAKHPEVKPRAIKRFEGWHVLAMLRQLTLELCFRYTRLSSSFAPRDNRLIQIGVGSNAWAVSPFKTKSNKVLLVINPHQPWFGFGQFTEGHLRSGEGWDFTGGTFYGITLPIIGHNQYCGWAATTNEPDIADAWRETFDDPSHPLNYRYGAGYRQAVEWKDVIRIKNQTGDEDRTVTFRKTHHGPIVFKEDETHYVSAMIAKLYEANLPNQALDMVRVKNLQDFRTAVGKLNFQYMNLVYGDRDGHIFYLYGGIVPRRDPRFDWSKPVDGSDPATEWKGYHSVDELPQVLDPPSGFVQNCNSSPFTTTDEGNPFVGDFPPYMVEDKYDDKRRAKRARQMLRGMKDVDFEQMQKHVFDNTVFWAYNEFPDFARALEELEKNNPTLAKRAAPFMKHLLDWDYKIAADSTQATLCMAWYEELYGFGYPNETLKTKFIEQPELRFQALIDAAEKLRSTHGDWKVPWAEIHRIQRHADVADFVRIPFEDKLPSLPSLGGQSPAGILFTQMYTPSVKIPFVKTIRKQYGVVGATYVSVVEFGEKVRSASLLQFGVSGDPKSPHYFDQAKLLSDRKLKPVLFDWDKIRSEAKLVYHPGAEGRREGAAAR